MGAEELAETATLTAASLGLQGVDDVVARLVGVDGRRDAVGVGLELLQRLGEGFARAEQPCRRLVGLELTAATHGGLDEHRRDRGEQREGELTNRVAITVVAAEQRPPHHHAGREGDPHADGGSHRPDEDVAIADVGEFVGEDAAYLLPIHRLEQPFGHGDGSVVGVAAGGEGVRLLAGRDVQPRHRHVRPSGEIFHDLVVLRQLFPGDGNGAC